MRVRTSDIELDTLRDEIKADIYATKQRLIERTDYNTQLMLKMI